MSLTQALPIHDKLYYSTPEKMSPQLLSDIPTPPPSREGSFNSDVESVCSSVLSEIRTPHRRSPHNEIDGRNDDASIAPLAYPASSPASSIKLPSYNEFLDGVKAMGHSSEPAPSWSPITIPRRISHGLYDQQPTPSHHSYLGTSPYTPHDYSGSPHYYPSPYGYDGYPNPATDPEGRHINKKYSTEEGDFIIYAWHDRKLKWQAIKQEYAMIFGKKPRRTVQGLQAWYYRMNQKIPVWDSDGWLIFDGEDELEPRQVSIKCRERDQGRKRVPELMGLAQRYPERLMGYHWVDPEIKQQARDWAAKRELQYRERRERRKKKEARRARL
ncbi:unnamed protein product [Clonostachys rosea]|uniref:Myb-like domain-containing protein n=1 Tax=Bionectria ochroleuca TaxID=29856 RepID=A0ABY6TTS7_BIOOC|nr:unnamed protein product [Clonostachys rosea]